ncbi:MAG TPA: hypothetical protein VHJ20_07315 [Polyangia bacterium]|nr:hypothetical protein [Polyangia bacterium]
MTGMVAAAPAAAPLLSEGGLPATRLAGLMIRYRLRFLRNGLRARTGGRFPTLVVFVGLFTAAAYVGMFANAFAQLCEHTDVRGQIAALAVVAMSIAFGSFTAKAASTEAVLAGSPENEFLLSRPVALPTLVVARCLTDAATDPVGALFLLPILLGGVWAWRLPAGAIALAAAVSLFVQLGISALAQATQIAVVRFVPRARRRSAWTILRLLAALALALTWMTGLRTLRAPATLAAALQPFVGAIGFSPGAVIVGPLGALARGQVAGAFGALVVLAVGAFATMAFAVVVARRAGMSGWEEAGATWTDAAVKPRRRGTNARPLTAATKDLALITRDRSQLVALISMPIIVVGVQLFGAAGWSWSTANLDRVSHLAFSITLYMATIGPLAHMQAERRAFWILRTVPVSVGQLLAAKAKAWSIIVGGTALLVFGVLSLGLPHVELVSWLGAALAVVVGAVGMSWLAVALAAGAADLSDESRPAIGPATIYTFLFVGFLYNVVLAGDLAARARGLALYAFAIAAYWQGGVARAAVCLDADAVRARRLTLGAGAAFMIALGIGLNAAGMGAELLRSLGEQVTPAAELVARVPVGLVAALYVARRRSLSVPAPRATPFVVVGAALAGAAGCRALGWPGANAMLTDRLVALVLIVALLSDELVFRAIVQRGLEDVMLVSGSPRASRALAAYVTVTLAAVALGTTGPYPVGILIVCHAVGALTRALTGRTSWAIVARAGAVVGALAFARLFS